MLFPEQSGDLGKFISVRLERCIDWGGVFVGHMTLLDSQGKAGLVEPLQDGIDDEGLKRGRGDRDLAASALLAAHAFVAANRPSLARCQRPRPPCRLEGPTTDTAARETGQRVPTGNLSTGSLSTLVQGKHAVSHLRLEYRLPGGGPDDLPPVLTQSIQPRCPEHSADLVGLPRSAAHDRGHSALVQPGSERIGVLAREIPGSQLPDDSHLGRSSA